MALRKVKLHGDLGEKFGKEFTVDVNTPAEAVRLLSANFKGFKRHLAENSAPGYHVLVGGSDVDKDALNNSVFSDQEIHIIPVIAGAGKGGGIFKIILGVALIWAAGGFGAGTGLGVGFGAGATAGWSVVGSVGVSLVMSGLSSMLFAPPSANTPESREAAASRPSYSFDGPVNTIRQGNPVSIGYGRLRVGSQVISAGLYAVNIPV